MLRFRMKAACAMLAMFGALALGGCATSVDPVPAIPDTSSFHNPAGETLQNGDTLRIVVFGKDDLSRTYTIDANGEISFGDFGRLKAAGLTVATLEQEITRLLAEHGQPGAQVSVLRD